MKILKYFKRSNNIPATELEYINATEIEYSKRGKASENGGITLCIFFKSGKFINIVFPNSQEYQAICEKLRIP